MERPEFMDGVDRRSIPTESRARYIETLRAADAGNYTPLIEFAAAPP
jgi:hypothetical protein